MEKDIVHLIIRDKNSCEIAKRMSDFENASVNAFKIIGDNLKHQKRFNRLCVIFAVSVGVSIYFDYHRDREIEKQLKELKQMNGE